MPLRDEFYVHQWMMDVPLSKGDVYSNTLEKIFTNDRIFASRGALQHML